MPTIHGVEICLPLGLGAVGQSYEMGGKEDVRYLAFEEGPFVEHVNGLSLDGAIKYVSELRADMVTPFMESRNAQIEKALSITDEYTARILEVLKDQRPAQKG